MRYLLDYLESTGDRLIVEEATSGTRWIAMTESRKVVGYGNTPAEAIEDLDRHYSPYGLPFVADER